MELRCAGGALINMSKTIIGISGWRYAPWRGVFYPKGLTQDQELAFASRQFGGIELNGSFYSLQRPEYYARWYAQTPPRSEEHTSELQSLMRTSYAGFSLKKKKNNTKNTHPPTARHTPHP